MKLTLSAPRPNNRGIAGNLAPPPPNFGCGLTRGRLGFTLGAGLGVLVCARMLKMLHILLTDTLPDTLRLRALVRRIGLTDNE